MRRWGANWRSWWDDRLLKKIVLNTSYLFSSNTAGMALSTIQSIFAARLLGVANFGVLGTITGFTSSVNNLFSFRMGELVVRYFSQFQADKRLDRAAALIKAAALVEGASSVFAYLLLVLLSPLAAVYLGKDASTAPLFMVYGVSILGNLVMETSTGVLQVTGQFRIQAFINLGQSILTALIIVAAFLTNGSLMIVLEAYLAGKVILGIGPVVVAWRSLGDILGPRWWRASFSLLPARRELANFALSTNFSATVNLLVRDSEVVWVAFFLNPVDVGYYKVALAIINLISMPITPFIRTTYPELSRSVAERSWSQLKQLLRRVTLLAGGWTGVTAIGLIVLGPVLIQFYGSEYMPAYPALLILLVGYGLANVLFWNRALLLSFNLPQYAFKVMFWAGLAKVGLAFILVPKYGYLAEAALLSGWFIIAIGLIAWKGLRQIRQAGLIPVVEQGG